MRNRIDWYAEANRNESFIGTSVFSGIGGFAFALWGLIALLDPTISNSFGWALIGTLPAVVHYFLYFNNIGRGLTNAEMNLLGTHHRMPENLRKEMPLTRKDVVAMTDTDCNDLRTKMWVVMEKHSRDIDGAYGRTTRYLDSVIETYNELGVK